MQKLDLMNYLKAEYPDGVVTENVFIVDHFHDFLGAHVVLRFIPEDKTFQVSMKADGLKRTPSVDGLEEGFAEMGLLIEADETSLTLKTTRDYEATSDASLRAAVIRYYRFLTMLCNYGPDIDVDAIFGAE